MVGFYSQWDGNSLEGFEQKCETIGLTWNSRREKKWRDARVKQGDKLGG